MGRRASAITSFLVLLVGCSEKEPDLSGGGIDVIYPLRRLSEEAEVIAEGTLVSFDPQTRQARVKLQPAFLGTSPAPEVDLDFTSGFPVPGESVTRHLIPGLPVVWFSNPSVALVYVNRFFIECYAAGAPPPTRWSYAYLDDRMNRTYNGPKKDLAPLVRSLLDGSVPGPAPDPALKPITVADLKALPVWGVPVDEEYLPKCFRKGKPPSVELRVPEKPVEAVSGLRWSVFEGPSREPAKFEELKPSAEGVSKAFSLAPLPPSKATRARFSGFLEVPRDGDYVFTLRTDDRTTAALEFGREELLKTTFGVRRDRIGDLSLKAGRHAIRVTVDSPDEHPTLDVLWAGPGYSCRPVPPTALFRDR